MPAPVSHRPSASRPPAGRGALGWIAALVFALAIVGWNAVQHARHYTAASAMYGVAVRAPAVDPQSSTGLADERRTMVYSSRWLDAQHWIMHTQAMLARGEWRLRSVPDDNAPFGRELHWASPWRWWLGACGAIDHVFSGRPLGLAVERGALWANPALLALFLVGLAMLVARRFGAAAAAFVALAIVGSPPLLILFAPDNMDHHGLAQACAMVSLFAVVAAGSGWNRNDRASGPETSNWIPTPRDARRGFIMSGIAGGIGLWVSAAGTIPILGGIALGALLSAWVGRALPPPTAFDPRLWRLWGRVGAATSLASYFLEYFPFHLGWRLEVNHPLYALAWWGGGEVLAQLTGFLRRGTSSYPPTNVPRLLLGLCAGALPALTILLWKKRVFAVSDPFHLLLSRDYTPEGRGFIAAVRSAGFTFDTIASCLPMLVVPAVALWLLRPATSPLTRAVLGVPFAATAVFWALGFMQLRWWAVSSGLVLSVIAAAAPLLASPASARRRTFFWTAVILVFAPGLLVALNTVRRSHALASEDIFSLAERDVAHSLRLRVGGDAPLVVLAAPATTSRLMYFGSADGLGTTFWENTAGLKRAAAIFAAKTSEEARALVRAAGITHIVCLSWDDFVAAYVRLARGLSSEEPIVESAFGLQLLEAPVPPPWLRRLPEHLPDVPALRTHRAVVFEVTDRTQPQDVLVRTAREHLYGGQPAQAQQLVASLEAFPTQLAAQVAIARIHYASQKLPQFRAALDRALSLREQAPTLEPEDRVDFISTLTIGGNADAARSELRAALQTFDDRAIRQLTPGSLRALLGLTERLNLPWPTPSRRELALELLPPDGRL